MTIDTEIDEISTEDRDESRFRALESRALKGTYFIVAFYGVALGLRFISSIVLARLFWRLRSWAELAGLRRFSTPGCW